MLLGTRARLLALVVVAAGTLPVLPARAAPVTGTPVTNSPASYVLKNAKGHCRAGYSKHTVTLRSHRHGKVVKTKQVRCERGGGGSPSGGNGSGNGPTIPANLPTATITLTLVPTAADHAWSTPAGQTLAVGAAGVLAGATGSGLSATLVSGPAHGSLTLNHDGGFSYTPVAGTSGIEHFTYRASSSDGESSTPATVTLDVTPLASGGVYATPSNQALSIPAGGLLAGAVGSGLETVLVSGPSDGSLTLNSDGSATYTPGSSFSGADSFSYRVVDAAGLHSNIATVTINVGSQPPSIVPETYGQAVGNTLLQVGGARLGGPEIYLGATSALAGDADLNGGSLSVTPGTITTRAGGSVSMSSNGDFTYMPALGFTGPTDTFTYTVNESEGLSATATATIDFVSPALRIWYVNDTAGAGGNGSSTAPFNALSAVAAGPHSPVAAGDWIYLEGTGTNYSGGIALEPAVTLIGAGAPLTAGGQLLVQSGQPSVLSGTGISVGEGDDIAGLTVSGTVGDGIDASSINSFTLENTVSVVNAGGVGLDISGGSSGTINDAAHISGSVGDSIAVSGRSGGTVNVSGPVSDTQSGGGGIAVTGDGGATIAFSGPLTISSGSAKAFVASGGGSVTATSAASTLTTTNARALEVSAGSAIGAAGLTFQSISANGSDCGILVAVAPQANTGGVTVLGTGAAGSGGTIQHTTSSGACGAGISITGASSAQLQYMDVQHSAGDGVYASDVAALTLTGLQITAAAGDGIDDTGSGSVPQGFTFAQNAISGQPGSAIAVQSRAGGLGYQGLITGNDIGVSGTAGSGSSAANGITLTAASGAVLIVEADSNQITGIATGDGISAATNGGTGDLQLTLGDNTITAAAADALAVVEGASNDTVCLNPVAGPPQNSLTGGAGIDVALSQAIGGAFAIQGYPGLPTLPATFLSSEMTLAHRALGVSALGTSFTGGSCASPQVGNT